MRIEYTCEDGSQTLATWPSMALLHWLGRSYPTRPIENPEPPNPKEKHGGKEYQARCLEVLRWLHAEGDITSLKVSSKS